MADGRLVYSTDGGDHRRARGKPVAPPSTSPPGDGILRVQRTRVGRGGKTVTLVTGLAPAELKDVLQDLKRHCGTGGTIRDGAVEIQGDQRDRVVARLTAQGRRVKVAGG